MPARLAPPTLPDLPAVPTASTASTADAACVFPAPPAQPVRHRRAPSARTRRVAGALALLIGALGASPPTTAASPAQPAWLPPARNTPLGAPAAAPAYRTVSWEALVPPGWNGMDEFRKLDLESMKDDDPRATALLKKLRASWDNAPVNMALIGQPVRLAGYIVPLEETRDGLTEFLLVPTYGACIHTPPPPANQIVHVRLRQPVKGVKTMDTVWVSGVLAYTRNDTYMGTAGWSLPAVEVRPTELPQTRPLH